MVGGALAHAWRPHMVNQTRWLPLSTFNAGARPGQYLQAAI
jgi:hypothetical protein